MRTVKMCVENNSQRLQTSIGHCATGLITSRTQGESRETISALLNKKCHLNCYPQAGSCSRNFLVPNKVRKAYISSEPWYVKQLPQEIQVLCTNIHSPVTHGAPRWSVCFHQPEGRVFSHPNLPSAHKMFEVCFLGHDLQIPRSPLWSLDKSVRMFIKYWGGCGSFQGMGHPPGHLPWQLAGAVGKRMS